MGKILYSNIKNIDITCFNKRKNAWQNGKTAIKLKYSYFTLPNKPPYRKNISNTSTSNKNEINKRRIRNTITPNHFQYKKHTRV